MLPPLTWALSHARHRRLRSTQHGRHFVDAYGQLVCCLEARYAILIFPFVPLRELVRFLTDAHPDGRQQHRAAFRAWVREPIAAGWKRG
jgi:hypothetical protein